MELYHSTVSHNVGPLQYGLSNSGGVAIAYNSILAHNADAFAERDCTGSLTFVGMNLVKTLTGCTVGGVPPIVATPLLGPLASNGGPTQTRALLAGSPALNIGAASLCTTAPVSGVDQRGVTRPQGAGCDLGAFELEAVIGGKNLKIATGSINLSWDGGTAQNSYTLLKYNSSTALAELLPLAGPATSYSDASATNGVVYCYVLAALNGPTFLGLSDLLCGMAGAESGTVVPQGFDLKLNQTSNATMTWVAPPGGADSYLLQRIPLDGSPITNVPLGSAATSTTQAVVAAGTCFQLIAFKGSGFGTSNVLCGVPGVSTLVQGIVTGGRTPGDALAEATRRLQGVTPPLAWN